MWILAHDLLDCHVELPVARRVHGERPSHGLNLELPVFGPRVDALVPHASVTMDLPPPLVPDPLLRLPPRRIGIGVGGSDRLGLRVAIVVSDIDHYITTPTRVLMWSRGRELVERNRCRGCGDARPAERAIGVGLEPGIYAVYMEDMEAVRQQPNPLLFLELVQAHSALVEGRLPRAVAPSAVSKRGDCPDFRLTEAVALGDGRVGHQSVVETAP